MLPYKPTNYVTNNSHPNTSSNNSASNQSPNNAVSNAGAFDAAYMVTNALAVSLRP